MNLNSLGIPPQLQAQPPAADFMPPALNQSNSRFWPIAVGQAVGRNSVEQWTSAVKNFVRICMNNNTLAFSSDESNNDKILTRLIEARREIVRFLNRHKVLESLKTHKVSRRVRMTSSGFVITVDVQAQKLDEDPTILKLLGVRQPNGRYTRNLLPDLTFFVYNEGARLSHRWHFGYDITVNIFPSLPGKNLPTVHEQERFILEVMYIPLVRCYRPRRSIHRLI